MNWAASTWTLPIAAALVGGAILVILHLLKVQPPRRTVATTMFWRQAVRQEHRRVLWGALSRWRTFLFLLLIVLLLALALAGTTWSDEHGGQAVVMVIDAGASMQVTDPHGAMRLDQAIELALQDLTKLGKRPVSVVAANQYPQLLVQSDQSPAIAALILRNLAPGKSPACSAQAIELAANLLPADGGRILWYTDRANVPDDIPETLQSRIQRRPIGTSVPNAAIVGAVFDPAGTDSIVGCLRVRIASWGVATPPAVTLAAVGSTTRQSVQALVKQDGTFEAVFDRIGADGGLYTIGLEGGAAIADDANATVRLPRRIPIAFRVEGEIPKALRASLDAISTPDSSGAAKIVVIAAERAANEPTIQLVSGTPAVPSAAKLQLIKSPLTMGLNVEGAACGAGTDLRSVDPKVVPLVQAGDAVAVGFASDRPGHLLLSDALFAAGSNVPQRPAFFVLLMRATHQMAGWTDSPVVVPLERKLIDPLWTPTGAPASDVNMVAGGRLTSDLSVNPAKASILDVSGNGFPLEPWQLALAAAITLAVIEGMLQSRGRMV